MRTWNLVFLATAVAVGTFSALGMSDVAVVMIQALFAGCVALAVLSIVGSWRHVHLRAQRVDLRNRPTSDWISFRDR